MAEDEKIFSFKIACYVFYTIFFLYSAESSKIFLPGLRDERGIVVRVRSDRFGSPTQVQTAVLTACAKVSTAEQFAPTDSTPRLSKEDSPITVGKLDRPPPLNRWFRSNREHWSLDLPAVLDYSITLILSCDHEPPPLLYTLTIPLLSALILIAVTGLA